MILNQSSAPMIRSRVANGHTHKKMFQSLTTPFGSSKAPPTRELIILQSLNYGLKQLTPKKRKKSQHSRTKLLIGPKMSKKESYPGGFRCSLLFLLKNVFCTLPGLCPGSALRTLLIQINLINYAITNHNLIQCCFCASQCFFFFCQAGQEIILMWGAQQRMNGIGRVVFTFLSNKKRGRDRM